MDNVFKLISEIPERKIKPMIYSIVFVDQAPNHNVIFNIQQMAYTFDEAIEKALKQIQKDTQASEEKMHALFPLVWSIADPVEMIQSVIQMRVDSPLNDLIKEIISTKNRTLFEENKVRFTEAEIKMIEDNL